MIHIYVSGDVQGVGFRQFVKYNARKLNIKGWVKNLPDGKVEVMLQGRDKELEKMVQVCKRGPMISNVKNVEIENLSDEYFEDFKIIKD